MNRVQNPVDYIREQRAYAQQAKRNMKRNPARAEEHQEIRRFLVLAAWTTRQWVRSERCSHSKI